MQEVIRASFHRVKKVVVADAMDYSSAALKIQGGVTDAARGRTSSLPVLETKLTHQGDC